MQHLDDLTDDEKDVFKTAFELDQRWVIELAADRTPEVCQSQSVNIFLPGDVDKWDLHMLHYMAWERGVKSLYYLRSKSVQRASFAGSASEGVAACGRDARRAHRLRGMPGLPVGADLHLTSDTRRRTAARELTALALAERRDRLRGLRLSQPSPACTC